MNREVLLLSFSAFFADMGYQAAIAIFPIFLVLTLGANPSLFGLASALAFGVGSFFGYIGGWMGDRFGNKWVAVLGNAFIPLISLMGLAVSPVSAALLFSGGWWARNFRTPPRRSMLVSASPGKADMGKVFGFLHMLDIGGGMISILLLLALLSIGLGFGPILLLTALPIAISTALLIFANDGKRLVEKGRNRMRKMKEASMEKRGGKGAYSGILIASSMYGFSSYSLGFPILTIVNGSNDFLGIGSYAVYLGVSAAVGYYIGSRKLNRIKALGTIGYILSGFGTALLGFAYVFGQNIPLMYLAVGILGFALGVIETLEPTLISFIKGMGNMGRGMGALTASRSIGIFLANLIMGVLYVTNPFYSYGYAAVVSVAAGIVVLRSGRGFTAGSGY
jgi:MFS family permease